MKVRQAYSRLIQIERVVGGLLDALERSAPFPISTGEERSHDGGRLVRRIMVLVKEYWDLHHRIEESRSTFIQEVGAEPMNVVMMQSMPGLSNQVLTRLAEMRGAAQATRTQMEINLAAETMENSVEQALRSIIHGNNDIQGLFQEAPIPRLQDPLELEPLMQHLERQISRLEKERGAALDEWMNSDLDIRCLS